MVICHNGYFFCASVNFWADIQKHCKWSNGDSRPNINATITTLFLFLLKEFYIFVNYILTTRYCFITLNNL
jgi:hypothetical protein